MFTPKKKIGQKVKLDDGRTGIIVATELRLSKTYLGHFGMDDYLSRFEGAEHRVAFEDKRGDIRTEVIVERP